MVVDIKTRVMVSYLPISIKRNGATGSKFRPSSPCDDLKEEIVDINVILVVSVIIVINLIVHDFFWKRKYRIH